MWWRKKSDHHEHQVLRCSFCNKWQQNVRELIAGPRVFICNECVEVCNDMLADAERVSKARGTRAPRVDEPMRWPNAIQCALCHAAIPADNGVVITDNRGTLCAECVKAVRAANASGE